MELFGMLVHTADLYSPTKTPEVSRKWVNYINQEFTTQYNEEVNKGYKTTPWFKDLTLPLVMARGECGFIKGITLPLWKLANQVLEGTLDKQVNQVEGNLELWNAIVEKESQKQSNIKKN